MADRTASQHVEWCKERAREYLDQGDLQNAFASMASDMGKHPETSAITKSPLMVIGLQYVMSGNAGELRRFIEGFN